jgi:hypothetical protein
MGMDNVGKSKNPVIRLMGFFVSDDPGKTGPRGRDTQQAADYG